METSSSSCCSLSLSERDFVDDFVFMPPKRRTDSHYQHFNALNYRGTRNRQDERRDERIAIKLFKPIASLAAGLDHKPLVIFAHGNACDLFDMERPLQRLANGLEVPILAFDYPGYGESQGVPSEASAYRAMARIVAYAETELGYPTSRIFLCGQSLGTGVVTHYAYVNRDSWTTPIILISPFRSIVKVVSTGPIGALASPLDRFQNETKFKDIKAPVKIYHGLSDQIIPADHSRKLLWSLPEPLRLPPTWLPGIGHNDILDAIPYDSLKLVLYGLVRSM